MPTTEQFRNLVFEGGGVKGIAYAGALKALEEQNPPVLPQIERVAGASAGAITAALVAAGADATYVEEVLANTRFRSFMDDSWGYLRDAKRLLTEFGWFKGDAFAEWMRKLFYDLVDLPDITFKELAELRESKKTCKELYMVGTNLSTGIEEVYSPAATPNMPVWHAVRISMSIPLFFAAVRDRGNVLVDGGVAWNYPVDIFDDKKYVKDAKAQGKVENKTKYGPTHVFNKQTLGLRVDTSDEIKAEKKRLRSPAKPIDGIGDYSAALLGFLLEMANKSHLKPNDWHRTVFIEADGIRTTDFDLSEQQIQTLVDNGAKGTKAYIKWFENKDSNPLNAV